MSNDRPPVTSSAAAEAVASTNSQVPSEHRVRPGSTPTAPPRSTPPASHLEGSPREIARSAAGEEGSLLVEVFTDPSCPWAWTASRWLKEVTDKRDLRLRWRSYCLEIRDRGSLPSSVPDPVRRIAPALRCASHRLLRVWEALRANQREDAIDELYTNWARRLYATSFLPPAIPTNLLEDCLKACGLDPDWGSIADDPSWDAPILDSMEVAFAFGGPETLTPLVVVGEDPPCGLSGPVIGRAPSGKAALDLWDAFLVLAREPSFFETSRPRQIPSLLASCPR